MLIAGKSTKARIAAVLAVGAAMILGTLVGAGPASADPGFCGERFDNVFFVSESVYVVHNKCNRPWSFRVWLPNQRRYAHAGTEDGACLPVRPGGYAYFADPWVDNNWVVRNC